MCWLPNCCDFEEQVCVDGLPSQSNAALLHRRHALGAALSQATPLHRGCAPAEAPQPCPLALRSTISSVR